MSLNWTGERYLPSVNGSILYEHYSRYYFAGTLVKGLRVLDAPCGEGYGSNYLSQFANEVVGIDISKEAVEHAQKEYSKGNLKFSVSEMNSLSEFEDNSFDAVVSFEGIEHVDRSTQLTALQEFKRVLKKGGKLIISSPNKRVYSDLRNYNNPYHFSEYYFEGMKKDLGGLFKNVKFFGQSSLVSNFIIQEHNKKFELDMFPFSNCADESGSNNIENYMYFVAVCSEDDVDARDMGLLDYSGDILKEIDLIHERELNQIKAELLRVEGDLKRYRNHYEAIKASRSWRLTAPLRSISSFIGRGER